MPISFSLTVTRLNSARFLTAILCLQSFVIFQRASAESTIVEHPEWKAIFDGMGLAGTSVIYDLKVDRFEVYSRTRAERRYTPASTFKIPNSLIALETGVVVDERNQIFPWDGKKREIESWNRDHTLRTAMRYSVVPVYQEIARQVGAERMAHYVAAFHYGNEDTSGRIDHFWLGGSLEISAFEQIAFLKKMFLFDLPVSERSIRIVKDILINEAAGDYVLRGKTGYEPDRNVGWYVGWVEKDDDTYLFATNIDMHEITLAPKRQAVTKAVLKAAGILE